MQSKIESVCCANAYSHWLFWLQSPLYFTGCSRNGSVKSGESSATGWKIGENGGFDYKGKDYKDQIQGPNLILIHGGTYTKGRVQDDVMKDWNNAPTRMQVRSFYMDETEVTNLMYIEYLDWLKRVFVDQPEIYLSALPDTLVWRNQLGYYDDMVNNYLRHPAFRTHPVVGVSWQQASNFAKWRTNRVNELILEEKDWIAKGARTSDDIQGINNFDTETYLKRPDLVYGGNYTADNVRAAENDTEDQTQSFVGRRAQITVRGEGTEEDDVKVTNASVEYGIVLPEYRLPTESEWEYAALGLAGIREYNSYQGKRNILGQVTPQGSHKVEMLVINSPTLSKDVEITVELLAGQMTMLKSLQMFANTHQTILACMEWQEMFLNGWLMSFDL